MAVIQATAGFKKVIRNYASVKKKRRECKRLLIISRGRLLYTVIVIARPISKNLKIERNPGSIVRSLYILLLYAKLKTIEIY